MFICTPCLRKSYENETSLQQSYGRCEDCGQTAPCNDIPSRYLREPATRTNKKGEPVKKPAGRGETT